MIAEKYFQSKDGLQLYYKVRTIKNPKALICVIHGFGEHINRYTYLGDFFNIHGYNVVGMDVRGHGRSEGKRGHAPSYESYLEDMDQFIATAQKEFPGLPVVLWGHSMGGNFVLHYLISRKPNFPCAVVTGPLIKLAFQPKPHLLFLGKIMRRIFPAFTQSTKLIADNISCDPKVVEAYKKDPLVHDLASASGSLGLLDAAARLDAFNGAISTPLLIMHGSKDLLTLPEAGKSFAGRVTSQVTHKMWEGLSHEIHNEPQKNQVLQYALEWMDSFFPNL